MRPTFSAIRRTFHAGLWRLCAGLLILGATPATHGQVGSGASAAMSELHIDVIEKSEKARLSSHDFKLSVAGRPYGVTVSDGKYIERQEPTHLLVTLANRPANAAPYSDVIDALDGVLARGWLVSIVRSDGYQTLYLSSAAALSNALRSGGPVGFDYRAAFTGLAGFAGRRVLIVEQPVSQTDPQMLAMARDLIPEIYRVDGGFPTLSMNTNAGLLRDASEGFAALPNPTAELVGTCPAGSSAEFCVPEAPGQTGFPTKRRTSNGVMHEVKFKDAVKDALKDVDSYYDLDLKVPAQATAGPLVLTYSRSGYFPFVFSRHPYLLAASSDGGKMRVPVQQTLAIKGR